MFSVRPVLLLAADWACISPSGDGTISGVGPRVGGQGSSPSGTSQPAHESTSALDLILGDCETCEVALADGRLNPSDSLAQEKRGRAERALANWWQNPQDPGEATNRRHRREREVCGKHNAHVLTIHSDL